MQNEMEESDRLSKIEALMQNGDIYHGSHNLNEWAERGREDRTSFLYAP